MGYVEQAQLAETLAFRARVKMALFTIAREFLQDNVNEPSPVRAGLQKRLAADLVDNPDRWVAYVAWILASVPSITASISDSKMQDAVNLVFRALSTSRVVERL